jgi:filamentous hemagglutinin
MNKVIYRVVFNTAFGLWTVVQETARAMGKGRQSGTACQAHTSQSAVTHIDMLSMRHLAFAALCVLGMQPLLVDAQVVAAPASGSKPVIG